MPHTLQLTAVHLRIANLARSLDFYARTLGFHVVHQSATEAELAASADAPAILRLSQGQKTLPVTSEAAGLFHVALLFPSRGALGGWLQVTAAKGVDFEGFSDHGVSEAIYLSDPDGNGLEFYADRPRQDWPRTENEIAMTTRPLALRSLLAEANPVESAPLAGAAWGHLHLRVTDLDRSEEFYVKNLGMEVMQRSFPGARFLAADGYHHHLGLNIWGSPRRPQPPGAMGLAEAAFVRAGVSAESRFVDPDGIHLRVQPMLVPA